LDEGYLSDELVNELLIDYLELSYNRSHRQQFPHLPKALFYVSPSSKIHKSAPIQYLLEESRPPCR
jgi:hypothetical protein